MKTVRILVSLSAVLISSQNAYTDICQDCACGLTSCCGLLPTSPYECDIEVPCECSNGQCPTTSFHLTESFAYRPEFPNDPPNCLVEGCIGVCYTYEERECGIERSCASTGPNKDCATNPFPHCFAGNPGVTWSYEAYWSD